MSYRGKYKVNYVIATYSGITRLTKHDDKKLKKNELHIHLRQLQKLHHHLSQITIMKPKLTHETSYDTYYDIDEYISDFKKYKVLKHDGPAKIRPKVVVVECENYGYSYGQYLVAYDKYQSEFNYTIHTECDYCPAVDDFDEIMVNLFNERCPNRIGVLSTQIQYKHPNHMAGIYITTPETYKRVYDTYESPISQLYKLYKLGDAGGSCQVSNSLLFTNSGIPILESIDVYSWPYWKHRAIKYYGKQHTPMFMPIELMKQTMFTDYNMLWKDILPSI